MRISVSHPTRLGFGLACGTAIALVDNFASGGEVSPVVVVVLLLAASVTAGALWGLAGWPAMALIWVAVPAPHVVLLAVGLPDTLHPATWTSIGQVAAFTAFVVACGSGVGALFHAGLASRRR